MTKKLKITAGNSKIGTFMKAELRKQIYNKSVSVTETVISKYKQWLS